MPYRFSDIELTLPVPPVELASAETGIALLLRRKGRPIDFLMRENGSSTESSSRELSSWIYLETKARILEEAIRDELEPRKTKVDLPSLSICVCTKDRAASLERCLNSVFSVHEKNGVEILVIDNAPSSNAAANVVKKFPKVRYILEPRPGLDFARNRAWREAQGELVAYLDDDVVVDAGWFDGLQETWSENPDAAGFTGLIMPLQLETNAQVLFEKRNGFRRGFEKRRFNKSLPGNPLYPCGAGIFGAGCNMTFRREALCEIGGFDEALDTGPPLPGGGDLDIFYRLIRAGKVLVYEPRYLVFHEHRRSEAALRHQYYTWGTGFMAFVTKSYRNDPPARARFRRLIVWWLRDQITQLSRSIRRKHVLPLSMIWAEFCGGIVGLSGEYERSLRRTAAIRKRFP